MDPRARRFPSPPRRGPAILVPIACLPDAEPPPISPRNEAIDTPRPLSGLDAGDDSPFVLNRRRSWARLIHKTWLCDPELCPVCGQRMKVVAAISSPAQDALIEKILRHTGQWDPPWLRKRKARGPPPARFSSSPKGRRPDIADHDPVDPEFDLPDRQPTDEDYMVDAPAPDDFA